MMGVMILVMPGSQPAVRTNRTRTSARVAAAALLLVTLAGCGQDAPDPTQARRTAADGEVFNEADVEFATRLIPHHAAALTMVDLTRERRVSPELAEITEAIQTANPPEIEQMVDWLNSWGEPIPATMRDHVNAGHHGTGKPPSDGADIPGMVTAEQLRALKKARGQAFETLWLQTMVEHHQGAIDLATTERADGVYGPAGELAETLQKSQQAQIDQMLALLPS